MLQPNRDIYFFNGSAKAQYLARYKNKDTKEVYGRIFKKSAIVERDLKKDLFHFTEEELRSFVLEVLKPKTKESSRSIYSTITSYIDWAIESGQSRHPFNPWKKRNTDYIYKLVTPVKNYMSYDEKQYILQTLVNAQDKFIVEALWNGIQGDQLSELVSLKIDDVQVASNEITIHNDSLEKVRQFTAFDEQLAMLATMANEQRLYIKKNGQCSENTISESAELVESGYIIKHSNTKHRGRLAHTTHYTIYNRIEMFRSLPELQQLKTVLVTKNIVRSGMIYYAMQLYMRDGELGRSQLEEVCRRFHILFKWSIKDFLNMDTIESLYELTPLTANR